MATLLSAFSLGLRVDKMVAEIRAIVGFIWLNRPAKEHDRIILLHFEDSSLLSLASNQPFQVLNIDGF